MALKSPVMQAKTNGTFCVRSRSLIRLPISQSAAQSRCVQSPACDEARRRFSTTFFSRFFGVLDRTFAHSNAFFLTSKKSAAVYCQSRCLEFPGVFMIEHPCCFHACYHEKVSKHNISRPWPITRVSMCCEADAKKNDNTCHVDPGHKRTIDVVPASINQ